MSTRPFIVLARLVIPDSSHAGLGTISRHGNKLAERCQNGSTSDNNSRLNVSFGESEAIEPPHRRINSQQKIHGRSDNDTPISHDRSGDVNTAMCH